MFKQRGASLGLRLEFVVAMSLIVPCWFPAVTALADEREVHVAVAGRDRAAGTAAAPFATPARALRELARVAKDSAGDHIRVVFHGGVYRIEQPLSIGPAHLPPDGSVTFTAARGERVVISGGRPIRQWTVNDDGTWSAPVPSVTRGNWSFRELFVNGQRRPRARHPNDGYLRIVAAYPDQRSGFSFSAGELPQSWTAGGELVFLHDWSTSRIPVQQVDHEKHQLTVAFPIGNRAEHYKIDHFEPHPRYYVENRLEFLDQPGEWLLDESGSRLLYRPLPGESPEATEAVAPLAAALLIVQGDDASRVRRVHFKGLILEHCGWLLPPGGFAGSQATAYERRGDLNQQQRETASRAFVPAAIRLEQAEDCSIVGCRIAHLGTSGVEFGNRTRRCRLEECIIEDVSGNGVNLGEDSSRSVGAGPWWRTAPEQAASGHIVTRNRIVHGGRQFFGAVAIWIGLARQMQITHNEIAHHPYTGVSLGWMWNPSPTPAGENVVRQNHIHHVMQVLSDGGGIYTLGRQPGTILTENLIHDVPLNAGRAESNGMFIDEGSDQITIVGNTIFNIDRSPLRFHRAEQIAVRNNVLVVPTADIPPFRYNNTNPQTITQLDNQVLQAQDFDLPAVDRSLFGPSGSR